MTRREGLALCVALTLIGCGHRYVVPTGEVGERPSPYALQGRIVELTADQMTVSTDDGSMAVVQLPPETKFMKVNDGVVFRQELIVGHRVRVWFDGPADSRAAAARRAAVVMLASLDPRDNWPPD